MFYKTKQEGWIKTRSSPASFPPVTVKWAIFWQSIHTQRKTISNSGWLNLTTSSSSPQKSWGSFGCTRAVYNCITNHRLLLWTVTLMWNTAVTQSAQVIVHRVLKWWNFWNYGICQDILKDQCPRGLLAKNEHFGANCLWDVSWLYLENSIQTLLIFFGSTHEPTPKEFKNEKY